MDPREIERMLRRLPGPVAFIALPCFVIIAVMLYLDRARRQDHQHLRQDLRDLRQEMRQDFHALSDRLDRHLESRP